MHAGMGASAAVADHRPQPDPDTGIELTIYSGTQNVTALRDTVARLTQGARWRSKPGVDSTRRSLVMHIAS